MGCDAAYSVSVGTSVRGSGTQHSEGMKPKKQKRAKQQATQQELPPEKKWYVVETEVHTGAAAAAMTMYMVTTPVGTEGAFHPLLTEKHQASVLAAAMNALRWDEDTYLDNSGDLMEAVESGHARRFIREWSKGRQL